MCKLTPLERSVKCCSYLAALELPGMDFGERARNLEPLAGAKTVMRGRCFEPG